MRRRRRTGARRRKNPSSADYLLLGGLALAAVGAYWYFFVREKPKEDGIEVKIPAGSQPNLPSGQGGGAQLPGTGGSAGGGASGGDGGFHLPDWMSPNSDDNQGG